MTTILFFAYYSSLKLQNKDIIDEIPWKKENEQDMRIFDTQHMTNMIKIETVGVLFRYRKSISESCRVYQMYFKMYYSLFYINMVLITDIIFYFLMRKDLNDYSMFLL